jgi:ubiquinone/menaquinone biosynthesis C-methylase UbiE
MEVSTVEQRLGPDQVPDGWSQIASDYERAFEKLTIQFSTEALRQLSLQPGERVLDVAAGTGSFALPAARAGGNVLATDFAPGMVDRIRNRIKNEGLLNIAAEVMDGQNLELSDSFCDVAASIVGVIFFPDITRGFSELKRVLKPGGRCAVVCWGDPEKFEMMSYLQKAIKTAVPEFEMPTQKPVWARLCGHEQLEREMVAAGFKNVKVTNMTGRLEIESPEEYWRDFTCSAPPLKKLFNALGENNTRRTGEVFIELLVDNYKEGVPCLTSEACVGIGVA